MVISRRMLSLLVAACLVPACTAGAQGSESSLHMAPFQKRAERLEAALNAGDAELVDEHFDLDSLLARVVEGIDSSPEFREGFVTAAKSAGTWGSKFTPVSETDGSYKLLRVRKIGSDVRALMRQLAEDGLNYLDLYLVETPHGIRIVDIHSMTTGETVGQMMRRMYMQAATYPSVEAREMVHAAQTLTEMQRLREAGEPEEALELFDALPARMKQEKFMLVMRVTVAADINPEFHAAAVEDYRRLFSNDATADLLGIDALLLEERWDELMASLDRLDAAVGGDPYIYVLRVSVMLQQNNLDGARQFAMEALRREPDMFEARDALLAVAVKEQKFTEVARILSDMEADYGMEFDLIEEAPFFADFVASPEYRKWRLARHAPKRPRPE